MQYRANSDLVVLSEITEVGERRGGAPTKLRGWGVGEGQCGPSDNKDDPIWENGYRGGRSH